jgi:hypothetical protein
MTFPKSLKSFDSSTSSPSSLGATAKAFGLAWASGLLIFIPKKFQ